MLLRALVLLATGLSGLAGAERISFHRQIRPLLQQRCQVCHQGVKPASGLSFTTYNSLSKAILKGRPEGSPLWAAVSGDPPRMPKSGQPLSKAEVEIIRQWIAEGAADDTPAGYTADGWWSLVPLSKWQPPANASIWGRTPIDAFILAKLTEKGLTPSPEADRRTLIRRLTYDLHGLPPTWEETQAFINDPAPDAYEKLVDRLLESPRYGERWGQHWLDVAHYGESHGYDKDKPRRNAWPFRDYVIRSFNNDKPYARFVQEQLAGDVLFPDDPDGVVATGFIAAGPWDFVGHVELREGTVDKKITRLLDRDDMVMTAVSSFVSMTAHCARCHDHKFDPITQEDYYSLQSVFAGVDRADRPYDKDPEVYRRRRPLLVKRRAIMTELQPLLYQAAAVTSPELQKLDEQTKEWRKKLSESPDEELKGRLAQAGKQRESMIRALLDSRTVQDTDRLQSQLADVDRLLAELPKPEMVYAASNFFPDTSYFRWPIEPRRVQMLVRGSVENPGKDVQPGALSAVKVLPARFAVSDEGERRAALAKWITDPKNMLAWRSIVNRVWHYHFGSGIVDTPNDFGRMGSLPTHPELLDWLAQWMLDNGGSLKKLHRMILLSAVYRQTSTADAEKARLDADNRFLWRMSRSRLDAESVRDSVLAVSGKLDLTMGGPSAEQFAFKDDHSPIYDYAHFDIDSPASYRRSIYRFLVRSVPDPFMERLDCPDPSLLTAKRNTTITAIQALALLNNPLLVRQAEHLAARLRALSDTQPDQVRWLYRWSMARDPSNAEARTVNAYAARHGLENACRLVLNSNEFLFVD